MKLDTTTLNFDNKEIELNKLEDFDEEFSLSLDNDNDESEPGSSKDELNQDSNDYPQFKRSIEKNSIYAQEKYRMLNSYYRDLSKERLFSFEEVLQVAAKIKKYKEKYEKLNSLLAELEEQKTLFGNAERKKRKKILNLEMK